MPGEEGRHWTASLGTCSGLGCISSLTSILLPPGSMMHSSPESLAEKSHQVTTLLGTVSLRETSQLPCVAHTLESLLSLSLPPSNAWLLLGLLPTPGFGAPVPIIRECSSDLGFAPQIPCPGPIHQAQVGLSCLFPPCVHMDVPSC